jgi:hypothetical protein
MRKLLLITGAVIVTLAAWGAHIAYLAHHNLVTLDVRNVDVRVVARSIEWQTWEKIIVHRDVSGKVTLNVHKMPLEQVLGIINEQISTRWMAIYPLYSSRKSLATLQKVAAGDGASETSGWLAFRPQPFRGIGGGMFAANLRAQNALVTMQVFDKDVGVVSLGLERFAQAEVVPEDGTTGTVRLSLSRATMSQAVSKLASQVGRHWARFYLLQPGRRFDAARREDPTRTAEDTPRQWPPPEVVQRMETQFEAQLETMTPEERQLAEQARQRWQEMRNLTPEQRRERMAQLATDPAFQQRMQQRMVQRLLNTTPEQRAERANRTIARRAARAAQNGGGGR